MAEPIKQMAPLAAKLVDPVADLYRIRYKDQFTVRDAYVRATSLPRARLVGETWVAAQGNERVRFRFLAVEPMVVADETILSAEQASRPA